MNLLPFATLACRHPPSRSGPGTCQAFEGPIPAMSRISAPTLHRIKALTVACVLASGLLGAAAAHALEPVQDSDTHVLPVWNTSSGRVEALLLLSPQQADGSAG